MKRRRLSIAATALTAALLLGGCAGTGTSGDSGDSEAPIVVGVLMPMSGPLSTLGQETYNGMEVARQLFNESGGVDGRMIEYRLSDAPTPDDAVTVAGELSTDDSVSLIMGSFSSNIAIPASAVASRNGKLYWETGSVAAETTARELPYLYRTVISAAMPEYNQSTQVFISEVAAPALDSNVSDLRFGIAYEDGAYGTSAAGAFMALAEAEGYNVVADEQYPSTTTDLTAVIERLKAADIDILYLVPATNDAVLFVRQAEELNFHPAITIGNGTGITSRDFVPGVGSAADGIVTSDAVPINISDDRLNPDLSPTYSEFVERFTEEYGAPPLSHATLGFSGAMVLFQEVLAKADSLDLAGLDAAAKAVDVPAGGTVAGHGVKFDETGQNERAGWYFMQYQDGALVPIFPAEFASAEMLIGGQQ